MFAIRSEQWKLHFQKMQPGNRGEQRSVICRPAELYNLAKDPGERQDLFDEHPEIVERLTGLANKIQGSMVAGRLPPPHWRSVLPKIIGGKKNR
jgi:arylsulfatase A-like enzyme